MSGQGTRIASISGLRGVVGNGIDPVVAAEFRGGLCQRVRGWADQLSVMHGRVSASIFMAAVEATVARDGRTDVLGRGRQPRRPSGCWCAITRRPAAFRSRRRTIPLPTTASSSSSGPAWC